MAKPRKRLTKKEFDLYYAFAVTSAEKIVRAVRRFVAETNRELGLN
ncbi:MAG: hypothetical protein PHC97_01075 [Patescibacteria group bacterium]|nr:hypothetical protein [Patescibacteria group bacterium]